MANWLKIVGIFQYLESVSQLAKRSGASNSSGDFERTIARKPFAFDLDSDNSFSIQSVKKSHAFTRTTRQAGKQTVSQPVSIKCRRRLELARTSPAIHIRLPKNATRMRYMQ
jgi:hypothetical protein